MGALKSIVGKYFNLQIQIFYKSYGVIMTFLCDRCKREIYKSELCNYCGKKICNDCLKSSMRVQKVTRLVICKDCWGNLRKRSAFKNKRGDTKPVEVRE